MAVTGAAVAGALAAEEADLHAFTLHSAPGVLAGLAVHLPGFLFLVGGLAWRAKLPDEAPVVGDGCACPPAPAAEPGSRPSPAVDFRRQPRRPKAGEPRPAQARPLGPLP